MKLGIFLGLHVQFFVGTVGMYELAEYVYAVENISESVCIQSGTVWRKF